MSRMTPSTDTGQTAPFLEQSDLGLQLADSSFRHLRFLRHLSFFFRVRSLAYFFLNENCVT